MIWRTGKSTTIGNAYTVGTVGFFIFAFGFLEWRVDPVLQYQYQMPVFFLGKSFLAEFWAKPGGLVAYGARFLAQFGQIPGVGALIATAILFALYLATRRLLGGVGRAETWLPVPGPVAGQAKNRPSIPLAAAAEGKSAPPKGATRERTGGLSPGGAMMDLVPAALLFLLAIRYDYPWWETSAGLLVALGAALAYGVLPLRHPGLRLVSFYVLAGAVGYAAGLLPAMLFVCVGALPEIVARRGRGWGAIGLVSGWLLVAGCAYGWALPPAELWPRWGTGYPRALLIASYLFYPLGMLLLAAYGWRTAGEPRPLGKGKPARKSKLSWGDRLGNAQRSGGLLPGIRCSLLLIMAVTAFYTFDDIRKGLIQVDYFAGREQWDKLLEAVSRLNQYNASSRLNINRALYHRGQLLEAMFSYRQSREFGLLPGPEKGIEICRSLSASLLELGQVNLAEHWAHEALEEQGDRPDILQLLVKINLAKEKNQAARTFLGRLRQSPFYRQWADDYLRRLDRDPRLAEDAELARLRSVRVTTDQPGGSSLTGLFLQQLVHSNPTNRMAFEYLMAHYLLALKPENIVPSLDRLGALGMAELPRHLQEALLAHQRHVFLESKQTVHLRGRTISPETQRRFDRFMEILSSYRGDAEAARGAMGRELGDTYWYYSLYEETFRKRVALPEVNP